MPNKFRRRASPFSLSLFFPFFLSPSPPFFSLRVVVLDLPLFYPQGPQSFFTQTNTATSVEKKKYNAEILRHSFCPRHSFRDRRSLVRGLSFARESQHERRAVCSRFTPPSAHPSFDSETPSAFAGFGPVRTKHCCCLLWSSRSLTYSGFFAGARAASKFVIITGMAMAKRMATLTAISRTGRLARTSICALMPCITLGLLNALVALFLSHGVNHGGDPNYSDLNVIFNPVQKSLFCLVSILGTIVSRQSLIFRYRARVSVEMDSTSAPKSALTFWVMILQSKL